MSTDVSILFESFEVGDLVLPNRIIMAPMPFSICDGTRSFHCMLSWLMPEF